MYTCIRDVKKEMKNAVPTIMLYLHKYTKDLW